MRNYVVDTSSLINLQQYYPSAAFAALWDKVGSLAEAGRMIAPVQVYAELKSKDDELSKWAGRHSSMFKQNSSDQIKFATMLADKHKEMRSGDFAMERADPYVISLAHDKAGETLDSEWVVVTEEGGGPGQIPRISRLHRLKHCKLTDVILGEGWSFS